MNREDIERLANNLRQINAFGKGGDTNRRRVKKEVLGKNKDDVQQSEDNNSLVVNLNDLPIEDQDRLINAGVVFDSIPTPEKFAIEVTPYTQFGLGQYYTPEKEWLRDWYQKNGYDNKRAVRRLKNTKITSTTQEPLYKFFFDYMPGPKAGAAYNPISNEIVFNTPSDKSIALHELNHSLQNEFDLLPYYSKTLRDQIVKAIGNDRFNELIDKYPSSYYYLQPHEIHSRLMEVRKNLNLSPYKNDIDDIDEEKLRIEAGKHKLPFTTDELRRLLKEVTYDNRNDYSNVAAFGGSVNKFDKGGGVKRKKRTAQEDMIYSLENSDMLPTFDQFSDDLSNTTAQQYMLDIAYNPKRWFENSGEAEARRAWARSNNLGFDELAYGLLDKKDQKSKEVYNKMPREQMKEWRTKDFKDRVRQAINSNPIGKYAALGLTAGAVGGASSPFLGQIANGAGNVLQTLGKIYDPMTYVPIIEQGGVKGAAGLFGTLGSLALDADALNNIPNSVSNGDYGQAVLEGMTAMPYARGLKNINRNSIKSLADDWEYIKNSFSKEGKIKNLVKQNPELETQYSYEYNIPQNAFFNTPEELEEFYKSAGLPLPQKVFKTNKNSDFSKMKDWWGKEYNYKTQDVKDYIIPTSANKKWLGYHDGYTDETYVNYDSYIYKPWFELSPKNYKDNINSTIIHENLSHGTDKLVLADYFNYSKLVDILKDNLSKLNKKFRINDSGEWNEMRASLNEYKNKLLKNYDYQLHGNDYYDMIDKIPDDKFMNDFHKLNGYTNDYYRAYKELPKDEQFKFVKNMKYIMKYSPALGVPLVINKNNKEENAIQ